MSALNYIHGIVVPAALALLPPKMTTPEARAMLIAIGLQESRFEYRRQVEGPARGYWQFELAGVRGVVNHKASAQPAASALQNMGYYDCTPEQIHMAITDNDILACVFARLLLWTLPGPLPQRLDSVEGYAQYFQAWRPGKPHRDSWDAFYERAWQLIRESQ